MRLTLFAAMLTLSSAAFAEDGCTITAGPHDVVSKRGDVVIEAGQVVEDAIAVDGKVTIKKGATVKSAVSMNGAVVVEDGATVTDAVVAIGGVAVVGKKASVQNVIELSAEHGLRLRGSEGDGFSFNFTIDGKSLGQRIVEEATSKVKGCKVNKKG